MTLLLSDDRHVSPLASVFPPPLLLIFLLVLTDAERVRKVGVFLAKVSLHSQRGFLPEIYWLLTAGLVISDPKGRLANSTVITHHQNTSVVMQIGVCPLLFLCVWSEIWRVISILLAPFNVPELPVWVKLPLRMWQQLKGGRRWPWRQLQRPRSIFYVFLLVWSD